jgi:citrate synthase
MAENPTDPTTERISAAEAAARLGVKRETLYAYVSRGLLESVTLDGKTSTFDPSEVAALRTRRTRSRPGRLDAAIVSSLTQVVDQRVFVRGHDLVQLARTGAGFEGVASLLWTGDRRVTPGWSTRATTLRYLHAAQQALPPDAPLLDRIRANVVTSSAADPLRHDIRTPGVVQTAPALIAAMVDGLPKRGQNGVTSTIASRLWPALTATRATPRWLAALDGALVLLADHDLAASTFAARVAASTRADPYSVVLAGLGALGGPLHGAASAPVHDLLETASTGDARVAVGERLAAGEGGSSVSQLAGFGHFLYPDGDPRAVALLDLVRAAAPPRRVAVCEEVMSLVHERTGVPPNVDMGLAALAYCARMSREAGEAVFAIARSAGWLAHALEEYHEPPLRFRPVTHHVGP